MIESCFWLSGGESDGSGEFGDGGFVGGGGEAELGRYGRAVDLGKSGAEQPGVGSGEEQCVPRG